MYSSPCSPLGKDTDNTNSTQDNRHFLSPPRRRRRAHSQPLSLSGAHTQCFHCAHPQEPPVPVYQRYCPYPRPVIHPNSKDQLTRPTDDPISTLVSQGNGVPATSNTLLVSSRSKLPGHSKPLISSSYRSSHRARRSPPLSPVCEELGVGIRENSAGFKKDVALLVAKLTRVFQNVVRYKQLLACRDLRAQKLLDLFQWLLDIPDLETVFRRSLIVAAQRISKETGLYPTCYNLKDVISVGGYPVAAGSFGDIYKGDFLGQNVCLKTIRIYQSTQVIQFLKLCSKEAVLWGQLYHPNVLPMYGLYRFRSQVCFVSPWMDNGDIAHFLNQNPTANRTLLASDVTEGLLYLHTNGIIHGDLKGANILVTRLGRACIADFGLSSVSDTEILHWTSHSSAASKGGSMRWQAPELFDLENDEVVPNNEASDVYAWSCVCYEIFIGEVPFAHILRDSAVMLKVKSGDRPRRPSDTSISWGPGGLNEDIWTLMEECWREDPTERPSISQILVRLAPALPVDQRPPESWDTLSTARFHLRKASAGGHLDAASLRGLHRIIDGLDLRLSFPSHPSPTLH